MTQPFTLQVLCTIFKLGFQWILVDSNLEYGLFKVEFEIDIELSLQNVGTILDFSLYLVVKKSDIPSWPTYHPTMSHFRPIMPDLPTYLNMGRH